MTPFVLQAAVISGLVTAAITEGFIFGQMSGMIDDMIKPDSHYGFTDNEITWIASTQFISGFIGSLATGFITDAIGRRRAAILLGIPILITWIMLYFAQSISVFILSRFIVGLSVGCSLILSSILTSEYTSPKCRNLSICVIMGVGPAVGTAAGHLLSTVMNWRYVALVGIIPTSLSAILPLFWVESPSWLASKGQYNECEKAFRALQGTGTDSEKELALLLKVEKSKQNKNKVKHANFLHAVRTRKFLNISILNFALSLYIPASGRAFLPMFAITIVKEITQSSEVVMYTFLLEGLTIFGAVLSIFFTKVFKTRPMFLGIGLVSSSFFLLLSASLYFKPGDISYMSWVNVSLFSLYFVFTNAGPYPLLYGLLGEIFPLDLKHYLIPINICTSGIFAFLTVKSVAWIFNVLGYHGAFLFYTILSLFCLFLLWVKLPETKGRTLQEIELYFENNTFENIDDLLSEQKNPLTA